MLVATQASTTSAAMATTRSSSTRPRRSKSSSGLSGKIVYAGGGGKAVFGFTGVKLVSPAGELEVVADPDCPVTQGRVTDINDWVIEYAGPSFIHSAYAAETGAGANQFFVWKDSSDAIEGRWSVIANLYNEEPRNHGVFPVS
jgi:hypothetical protein